ncbi:MAG: BspA family leucine-rich repeat surface protein [Bacteroidota bacterium]
MKIKSLRLAFVLLLMMTAVSTVMSQTNRYISIWDSRKPSFRTYGKPNSNTTIALNTMGHNYSIYYEKVGAPGVNLTIDNITSDPMNPYILEVPSAGEYRIEAYDGNGKLQRLFMWADDPDPDAVPSHPPRKFRYDNKKLIKVIQYGDIQWASLDNAFWGAENMEVSASIDKPNLSGTTNLQGMFYGCKRMTYPNDNIGDWDVSGITNMSYMFSQALVFNKDISNWKVGKVTRMASMFASAAAFNQPIGNWDVSKVTKMDFMFAYATAFNQPIGNWNVSSVIEMQSMFFRATSFNQDLSRWNVSNVQKMQDMFNMAIRFNSELKDWNVGNVTDMTNMFFRADQFKSDLSRWDVSNVVSMAGTFHGAADFESDLSQWKVNNCTNMKNMFRNCSKFKSDLSQWNVERVKNMSGMFAGCIKFNSNLSNWRVGNVEDMNNMFNDCTFFNSDLSNWDVSKVTDMGLMFRKAVQFNSDISNWNVSLVSNMKEMFFNAVAFNQDLSKWNLSALTDAGDMLSNSNMDCKNYSVTLASWGASTNTPHRPINFGAKGRPYSRMGYAGLEELRKKGWQIAFPGTYAPYCDGGNADNDFVTVWKTDNHGATTNTEIAFPAIGTNYIIEWTTTADPSTVVGMAIVSNSGINTPYKIRLNTPGSYIVRAFKGLGSLTGFNMGDGSPAAQGVYDPKKLLEVRRWGNNEWTTLDRAFFSAENMDVTALDAPNLSKVTTLKNMFDGCKSLRNTNNSINSWNVETITNMSYMFNNAEKFDAQLNNWNVGNVTDMSYMFFEAKSFNSPIASWDTKSVTNMEAMFALTENFNKSINDWNVSNVVNMKRMFNSAIKFNQPLDGWNIKSLRNAEQMLSSCGMDCIYYSLTIIAWADNSDTPSNITLGADNMFYNSEGNTARNYLQNNLHWTIQGDNPDPNCSGSIVNIWVGSISNDWDTSGNWDSGHIPEKNSEQDIVFATAANHGGVPAQRDLHINGEVIVGKLINDNPTYGVVINPQNSMTANRILGSETAEKAGKIQLKSTQAGNGALIVKEQPASKPIFATVQMYSKAKKLPSPTTWIDNIEGSPTKGQTFSSSYQWQYIGIPMVSQKADNTFYKAYMRRYDETYNGDNKRFFQKWHKVKNYDLLEPFVGYEITREQPVVYEMKGQIYIGDKQLTMTRRAAAITTYEGTDHKLKHYGLGHNIFGNSYTASIIIDKMELPDEVDKTIYIYNTGTFSEWAKQKGTLNDLPVPGRYMAIPQGVASLLWANRIPSMQGFMLKFKDEETVYNRPDVTVKIKYDGGVIKNVFPQRAPALNNRDRANTTEQPAIAGYVKIGLIGENAQDIMWLIEAANTTDGYDNGFDGENISLQTSASIFAQTPEGKQLQVSSQPSIIDKPFYFRTQNDGKYELILVKNDLNHYHDLQLLDMKTETYTQLSNDTTVYSFSSEGSNGNIEKRFVLVNKATPTNITDGYDNGDLLDVYLLADKKLLVINNMTQTNATMTMSDITGRAIMQRSVPQGFSQIPVDVANGVYIVSMKAGKNTKNVKVIVK